ncbi:elongation factor G [candidate division KSB1 bacterium]|nr:elongation factor G [candidate division KSB1 bacterium]
MKEHALSDIRNIALVSHQSVGKTTLAEGFLFSSGISNRMGTVDDGTTTSDYRSDEIERKISIGAALMTFEWKKNKYNVLDLPGYQDFLGEDRCGLRVADLALVLLNATAGIEVGTELAWDILEEFQVPRMFVINRLDKEHADFNSVVAKTREVFGNGAVPIQFPVNAGEGFNSIIDLLQMKKITFATDKSGKYEAEEIPADLKANAEELRNELVEKIAESDDEILEKYFETGELEETDLIKGLRLGIITRAIFPIACSAAALNMGTHTLLDFINEYGPSPAVTSVVQAKDSRGEPVEVQQKVDQPFAGFVFKTLSEMHVGELSLIRVYSGQIKSGDEVLNTRRNSSEKIGQIYTLCGKNRSEVSSLSAGEIGALVKLKDTHTSDTLAVKSRPVVFDPIVFPEPVVQVAVSPKAKGDEEKISNGLHTINEIDPSFTVTVDPELKQTVLSGQGELHLTVILQRLKERFGVEIEQKKPKIAYRETITGKADEKYRHKKQSGGAGQFAEVWMRIEPLATGGGFEFESQVVGGAISSVFIPSIEKGVKQVLQEGAIAGYKIVDVKAIVYDGKEHPVDSKDIAFQIAGREVFKMCIQSAKPILLEPIYNVTIKCPEEFMGDVMGDLSSRRGRIQGMESQGHFQLLRAQVPLAELHDYATRLRSLTQGRATHTRIFSHYDPVPKELEAKVIQESKEHDA